MPRSASTAPKAPPKRGRAKKETYDPDRDEGRQSGLWGDFEGQAVPKVIMTFGGELTITDPEVADQLGYLQEVEFIVRGTVTGKKHSYSKGMTVGNATVTVESISLGNSAVIEAKTAKRARAYREDVSPNPPAPTPIRPEMVYCGMLHDGFTSPCTEPLETCELGKSARDATARAARVKAEEVYGQAPSAEPEPETETPGPDFPQDPDADEDDDSTGDEPDEDGDDEGDE